MPEKQFDFWIWLWSVLTGPDMRAALWAGAAGLMRALALRVPPWEAVICVVMAVFWGTVLYPFASPLFDVVASPILGRGLNFPRADIDRAVVVLVGLSGVGITGFVLDFFAAWRKRKTGADHD